MQTRTLGAHSKASVIDPYIGEKGSLSAPAPNSVWDSSATLAEKPAKYQMAVSGRSKFHPLPKRHWDADMVYGVHPVELALQTNKRQAFKLYLREGASSNRLAHIVQLASRMELNSRFTDGRELETLCGSPNHQGVVLECGPLPRGGEREAIDAAKRAESILLVLDQVNDPQNLGAAIRNAAVFALDGVVVPRQQSAPLSPAASKASAGRMEEIPIYEVANLARFLGLCRKSSVWVLGAGQGAAVALGRYRPVRPLVVVMGGEHKGLRPLVKSNCDELVAIPTRGGGSLNVAAATAIILYHLTANDDP